MQISFWTLSVTAPLALLLSALSTAAQGSTSPDRLRAAFDKTFHAGDATACLVAREGEVVFTRTTGRLDSRKQVTDDSLFDIGPLAETFTAAAVMRLSMAGKLGLDDSIADHLPEVPAAYRTGTLRHLLSHTSNLPVEIVFVDPDLADRHRFIAALTAQPTTLRSGRYVQANPLNYSVAAAVIESAAGTSFEKYVAHELFRSAKMRDTAFRDDDSIERRRAVPRFDGTTRIGDAASGEWHWGLRGHAGIISSLRDLHRWHEALQGDALLDRPHREELFSPYVGKHGLGWTLARAGDGSNERITAGGETEGFRSLFTYYVPQDTLVLLLSNSGVANLDGLQDELAKTLVSAETDETDLERMVGRYRLDRHNDLDVALVSGKLQVRSMGQEASARLFYGQETMPEWPRFDADIADRAAVLLRPMLQKDLPSFARNFHSDAPARAAEAAIDLIKSLVADHGEVGQARLLGTKISDPMLRWFRVAFGQTPITLRIEWHGEELHRVTRETVDFPIALELLPLRDGAFTAMSLDGEARLQLEFRGQDKGPAKELRLFDRSKRGKRGIRCKRIKSK